MRGNDSCEVSELARVSASVDAGEATRPASCSARVTRGSVSLVADLGSSRGGNVGRAGVGTELDGPVPPGANGDTAVPTAGDAPAPWGGPPTGGPSGSGCITFCSGTDEGGGRDGIGLERIGGRAARGVGPGCGPGAAGRTSPALAGPGGGRMGAPVELPIGNAAGGELIIVGGRGGASGDCGTPTNGRGFVAPGGPAARFVSLLARGCWGERPWVPNCLHA